MSGVEMEVAVRGWAPEDVSQSQRRAGRRFATRPSPWSLVLDTETTTSVAQSLRFGTYQVRLETRIHRQGLFFDPQGLGVSDLSLLREYADDTAQECISRAEFVRDVFFKIAWSRRGLVIGFNLLFDISRIAVDHAPSKPRHDPTMRGGFSFVLTQDPFLPRIQTKRINSRANMIRMTTPSGRHAEQRNREQGGTAPNHNGYFVDVATLASALLSFKGSLGRLAKELGAASKMVTTQHGARLSRPYLDYAMHDVEVTWQCYEILRRRYDALELTETPIHRILSEASIGKAYLRQLGLHPR